MGTDYFGRDLLARILYGGRLSLSRAVAATSIGVAFGLGLGVGTGYIGGAFDRVVMAVMDFLLAFPGLFLALLLVGLLGPGLSNVMVAVAVSSIPSFSRVARAGVLKIRIEDFVEASRASGAGVLWVIARHILPNLKSQVVVLVTLAIGQALFAISSLGFLGLGAQPPIPEWGAMVAAGRDFLRDAWWVSIIPGLAIGVTVLAINFLGDGLCDVLDPTRPT